jgi:hypothetical protein
MSTAIQRRRGSTAQHNTFTGLNGETTVDTDKRTVVVHDGVTAGGFPLARQNLSNVPNGTIGSALLADGAVTTAKMADGAVTYEKLGSNVTPILTGRNKIINGAIKVDQRNAGGSQTFTAGAALAYCVDRWYGYCTGANITGQRIALSNAQNRFRFTGAASNTGLGFGQRIEAVNSMDLAGGTATLSVKLSSSSLTSITWTAFYANTTDAFGTLASPTRTQIATGTFTINSTEATYSTNISVPSAATTGIEIVFTGGALLATQTLTIGDAQLEVGSVATPFEHRSFGTELTLCQRYAIKIGGDTANNSFIAFGSANNTTTTSLFYYPLVTFRSTPSLASFSSLVIDDSNGAISISALVLEATGSSPAFIRLNATATGLTQFRPYYLRSSSNTGNLVLSAEL